MKKHVNILTWIECHLQQEHILHNECRYFSWKMVSYSIAPNQLDHKNICLLVPNYFFITIIYINRVTKYCIPPKILLYVWKNLTAFNVFETLILFKQGPCYFLVKSYIWCFISWQKWYMHKNHKSAYFARFFTMFQSNKSLNASLLGLRCLRHHKFLQ